MFAEVVVTQGYLYAAMLVAAMYAALGGKVRVRIEVPLATALGLGVFLVAMVCVFPAAVGGVDTMSLTAVMP